MFKLLVVFSDGLAPKRCSSRAAVCVRKVQRSTARKLIAEFTRRREVERELTALQNVDGDELVVDGDQLSLQRVAQA